MATTSCTFAQLQAEQVTTSLTMFHTIYPAPLVQAELITPTIPRHQPGSSRLYEGADGLIPLKPFVCSPTTRGYSRQVGMPQQHTSLPATMLHMEAPGQWIRHTIRWGSSIWGASQVGTVNWWVWLITDRARKLTWVGLSRPATPNQYYLCEGYVNLINPSDHTITSVHSVTRWSRYIIKFLCDR